MPRRLDKVARFGQLPVAARVCLLRHDGCSLIVRSLRQAGRTARPGYRHIRDVHNRPGRTANVRDRRIPQRRVKPAGGRHQGRRRGERWLAGRGSCRGAGGSGEPGPPGHPCREAGLPVVLADRAPFPAGGCGDEPEPAVHSDGDCRADQEDPAGPMRQHRGLASPRPHRGADRAARRDQRRARRVRHGPRLPAARERNPGTPVRLDDPGPGAQPQIVRGGGRDHPQMLDRAVVRASRREFLHPAVVHEMESQADHRVFPDGQGRAPAGGRDRDRRARYVPRPATRCRRRRRR